MIRRDTSTEQGPAWLLISQIDHASLSGRLAEHWESAELGELVGRDELLPAIYAHDDGWKRWEAAPGVDPKHARPYSFTEMPLASGLKIWHSSIAAAAQIGPLAGYAVCGHFCALLERSLAAGGSAAEHEPLAQRFLAEQRELNAARLKVWLQQDTAHTAADADRALAQLQLFDGLSLWLCCAHRSEAESFEVPGAPLMRWIPQAGDELTAEILVRPWPWRLPQLTLSVPAQRVPATRYADTWSLLTSGDTVTLTWRLMPAD